MKMFGRKEMLPVYYYRKGVRKRYQGWLLVDKLLLLRLYLSDPRDRLFSSVFYVKLDGTELGYDYDEDEPMDVDSKDLSIRKWMLIPKPKKRKNKNARTRSSK